MLVYRNEWEKTGTGLDFCNVSFSKNDSDVMLVDDIPEDKGGIIVVNVSTDNMVIQEELKKKGYSFVDEITYFQNDLLPIARTSIQQRLYESISVSKMNKTDLDLIKKEVNEGFFGKDWIGKESHLGMEISKKRNIALIDDLWENGTYFYKHMYKGSIVGFFTLNEIAEGVYESKLGGLILKYRGSGLGTVVKVPEIVRGLGGKKVVSSASKTDIEQYRSLILNGYIESNSDKVFIKFL